MSRCSLKDKHKGKHAGKQCKAKESSLGTGQDKAKNCKTLLKIRRKNDF